MALAALPSLPTLPRRDHAAREHLDNVARGAGPVVLAGQRLLPVVGELGELLPGAGLRRGSVVTVDGDPGAGATSVAFRLVAAATDAGEWAAAIDLDGTLGGWAAAEQGVALDRFAVVQRVPPARWATVVAALLDGVGLVLAEAPAAVRAGDARRLVARARERDAVLVVAGQWPAEAAVRLHAEGSVWRGLEAGAGRLADRALAVRVDGRGAAVRPRVAALALVG